MKRRLVNIYHRWAPYPLYQFLRWAGFFPTDIGEIELTKEEKKETL